ncbi:putative DNA-binding transcriptional regulator YafY [Lactobacillus colini]|uniref:DNA-binding transcriptional regulator YafY n=1 Tax=Lactobacillus colini TaxID=1819254 RepID=A0ABS4MCG3_9LACO|nr:WYL domain-containing protein [Lactobacillus colini]MBP2057298.1 putative DNA-binding transcriptional regulator YafY [Lactobacillus colini]
MKKSERLNQELIYLSYRSEFHLQDLEDEFGISERTAIRDVADLESMGLKFYVERGRYGAYKLIHDKLWIPIRFNFKEINAIFFAIKALERISATPFSNAYDRIYQKLMKSLPPQSMKKIQVQQQYVKYHQQPSLHKVEYFGILLKAAVEDLVLELKNDQYIKSRQKVQVYELFYQSGNWFCKVYNLELRSFFILRCDKILDCQIIKSDATYSHSELRQLLASYNQAHYDVSFKCEVSQRGRELFLLDEYPEMNIIEAGGKYLLTGKINHRELDYLTDYLLRLGPEVKIIEPIALKKLYLAKLKSMLDLNRLERGH